MDRLARAYAARVNLVRKKSESLVYMYLHVNCYNIKHYFLVFNAFFQYDIWDPILAFSAAVTPIQVTKKNGSCFKN